MKPHILCALLVTLLSLGPIAALAFEVQAKSDAGGQKQINQGYDAPKAGERVFMANCSRCHVPPMSITPRTTGTVIMHMRVRARLSRRDEQLLLKYMAP
jgi:cytochrome c553